MIEIVQVKTKKQKKQFVDFPTKLYNKNPYYVPAFRDDELNMFDPQKNANYDECDSVFYLAYKEGKVAGRISGIIQKTYNQKVGQKRARFGRFDCINDQQVANKLFEAVQEWAKEKQMTAIHGPLGFNDLEREGLLIQGFDQPSTIATAYNYSYYQELVENSGYIKEIDSVEYRIYPPKQKIEKLEKLSNKISSRYHLTSVKGLSVKQILNKYSESIFNLINQAYAPLYGVVPINEKVKQQLLSQFKLIVNPNLISLVINENNELVGFGLIFPDITKQVRDLKGKIVTVKLLKLLKLLYTIKHPKTVELALIAVNPEYRPKGATLVIINDLLDNLITQKIEYAESNPELETNQLIQTLWNDFEKVNHKRRRFYIKNL